MAPEILKGRPYGRAVDWWALGVTLFQMLVGRHPFLSEERLSDQLTEKDVLDKIVGSSPDFPTTLSKEAKSLLVGLLCKEPTLRLGSGADAIELRNHAFFSSINWKLLEAKKLEPPLRPHLQPNNEVGLDPWSSLDGDDTNFEFLTNSQQEQFRSFSYTAPTELSRSSSSPIPVNFTSPRPPRLHTMSHSPQVGQSPTRFATSAFSPSPPMKRCSAFLDLSQYVSGLDGASPDTGVDLLSSSTSKLQISQHRRH